MNLRPVRQRLRCLLAGATLVALVFDSSAAAETGQSGVKKITTYRVKGAFLESRSAGSVAVIAHDTVPGYMDAMTMPFQVRNPSELAGLHRGDQISFRLSVTDDDDWIDDVKRIKGHSKKAFDSQPAAPTMQEVEIGASVPDCVLTSQKGQIFRLSDFRGQALALTFFFSRCPLPTFCPRMNNNFAAVQQALKSNTNCINCTNWQLLSISFDPSFDTPEHLADVAMLQGADAGHWTFGTSSAEEIRKLGGAFGLKFWRESGSFSHNLRTVVVNAAGRVQKVLNGNEWQPAQLVAEMQKAMGTR